SRADLQRHQHGQFAPARARENPDRACRRNRRQVQGQPSPCVPGQHATELEHAVEHARSLRHSPGPYRRQHGTLARIRLRDLPMKLRSEKAVLWFAIAVILAGSVMPVAAQNRRGRNRPIVELPKGTVRQVILNSCTACHGIDDYAYYAMDRPGWQKLIDSMKEKGAVISDDDRSILLDWLVSKFGPDSKPFARTRAEGPILNFGGGAARAAAAQDAEMKPVKIDHISIQVRDLPRSIRFYQTLFGLHQVGEDKPNVIVRLRAADKTLVSLHHKAPRGIVDHFAIAVEGFDRDAVTQKLKQRGINPEQDIDAGFHVKDPEGISVQIVGA